MKNNNTLLFIAFYSKQEYDLLLKYADDRHDLDDKWEDWFLNFMKAKSQFQQNFDIKDFHVKVEEMNKYFKANKLKNNSTNRSKYTTENGAKEYKKRNLN